MRATSVFVLLAATTLPLTGAQAQELQLQPHPSANADQSAEVFAGVDYQEGDYGTGAKVETVSTELVCIR